MVGLRTFLMVFSASLLCRAAAGDFWPLIVTRLDTSWWCSAKHTEDPEIANTSLQTMSRMHRFLNEKVYEGILINDLG